MKKFYTTVLTVFLILVVLVVGALGLLLGLYEFHLKPEPAEFEFSGEVENITTAEVIRVNKLGDNQLELVPLKEIDDVESFLLEFRALQCYTGLSLDTVQAIASLESIEAIRITYSDDSYEVITPYGNINSKIFTPDFTPDMLLEEEFFFFNAEEFSELIDKYTIE